MLSSLDDVLSRITNLTPQATEELASLAIESTKAIRWLPNPGPQTVAYFSEADEIFYGGQAGGGKTDLELGLAVTAHQRSLILRRTNKEAAGLVERMAGILGTRDGWSSQGGIWRLPEGTTVEIGGCQLEEDRQKYKGLPHDLICVGLGTPVLMGDMSYKAIENIAVGEEVMTLEGPRKVKKAFPVGERDSLALKTTLPSGEIIVQIQSTTHKILTCDGWVSPDTQNASHLSLRRVQNANEYREQSIASAKTSHKYGLASLAPHKIFQSGQNSARLLASALYKECRLGLQGLSANRALAAQGTYSAAFGGVPQVAEKRHEYFSSLLIQKLHAQWIAIPNVLSSFAQRGVFYAQRRLKSLSSLGDYPYVSRSCGVHTLEFLGPRAVLKAALAGLHQLSGAALRNPNDSQEDGGGTARTHSHHTRWYAHPYTMEKRQSILLTADATYSFTPVGKVELYDLEIEEVNHFITYGGIVNKNCFDEVSDFSETQYTFIIGWNRSADPKQRCRIVAAGNPPTQPEGLWVLKRWGAWLDPTHPNPAQAGELRWYTTGDDGKELEVDGRGPHTINGEEVYARSRTFIPAKLSDNPDLAATDYAATLAALPAELRAAYRDGSFTAGLQDNAFQTIPTSWVRAAQQRWRSTQPVGVPMCAIGVDVAQGGNDNTVIATRYDGWYPPLKVYPGKATPDGKAVGGLVVQHRRNDAKVIIDIGGGWGGDAYAHLRENGIDTVGYMGVKQSLRRTVDNQLKFTNVRTEAYWRFREALDESQDGGSPIQLPEDPELVADLCAPSYKVGPNGISVEAKVDVVKRLGRSPDKGDAVVMAWWAGNKQSNIEGGWKAKNRTPTVNIGRVGRKR